MTICTDDLILALQERRIVEVVVNARDLCTWLITGAIHVTDRGLPDDALLISVRTRPETDEILLRVAHPSFSRTPAGAVCPDAICSGRTAQLH